MSEEKTTTIYLLLIGVTKSKKKKAFLYYEIDPDENNGDPLEYDFKKEKVYPNKGHLLVSGAQPGTIVSIDATLERENGGLSVYPSSARLYEKWKNEDDVIRWTLTHRAKLVK